MDAEQRRAERRQRLLEAALGLFTTIGYRQTKIVQICAEAGVSTRNFYEEFAGKEQVLLTLHDLINSVALDRVRSALATLDSDDVVRRISLLLDAFVASVTADPRLPRLNYVEAVGVSEDLERQHQEWVTRWADFIEAEARHAAAHGVAPDRDYRLTAIGLVGAITGLLREWQAHQPPWPVADIAAEIRGLMLAAILR
ncbi:TetR/AcrR family transcriptional regulator [Kutzneria chonburiensis]|uniref:TetR/AcrR family transcriptional regulator n=1 Tax=Kutzneria chonburiensis TaxID=1483604 RepID=A0ABV6MMK5_9PSEU|nr:TetR/AcrR family transcriptional regulator [Kutzneria chonburiensis]